MICHGKNNSNEYPKGFLRAGVAMLPLALAAPAQAVDLAWSGFGTLGYAQSDQPVNYQRFIDEKGTFKRDSVLGAQVDALFTAVGATLQVKAAPSNHSDAQWQASLAGRSCPGGRAMTGSYVPASCACPSC
jgi:opacity protein-like surface antigen